MKVYIKIDNQEESWEESFITPKDILELGQKVEPYSLYVIFQTKNGQEEKIWNGEEKKLHTNIKIKNGDEFSIENKKSVIHYTVNGETQEISAVDNKLTIKQILEKAEFVPVEKFKLFNAKTEKEYINLDEEIAIKNEDKFLALSSGPTPVA